MLTDENEKLSSFFEGMLTWPWEWRKNESAIKIGFLEKIAQSQESEKTKKDTQTIPP